MYSKKMLVLVLIVASRIGTMGVGQDAMEKELTIADTRTEMSGKWKGKLEYRDYQADRWFGIPVEIDVELIKDGATVIRKAQFDDGASGTVYITNVSMFSPDGKTEFAASFRADRPAEMGTFSLRLVDKQKDEPQDATHWTVIAERTGKDAKRSAMIRETTTRNGNTLTTLKEVNFTDDEKDEWLQRNRTVLKKVG